MISNAYVSKILNVIAGVADSITFPATVYFGVCVTQPAASNGAVSDEPTAASYARKLVGGEDASKLFGSASGGVITNKEEVQLKTARENMGNVYWWFLSDSKTGNAIIWGKVYDKDGNEGIEIKADTVPTFYEGELKASIDVALS